MLRRGFLAATGAIAASPAIGFGDATRKNWHCIIGGCRSGKSTKAAKMVSQYEFVCCVVRDGWHFNSLHGAFGGSIVGSMCCWPDIFMPDLDREDLLKTIAFRKRAKGLCRIALWIDECTPELNLKIAEVFDIVVLSSYPNHEILEMPFYQECLRLGNVEHLQMLPHAREKLVDASWTEEDRIRRIEGRFA